MAIARKYQIDLTQTLYYHCMSRCVRRSFLMGADLLTGRNFEHRRNFILNRIKWLQHHCCIKVCAYALMSNHYHLVLKAEPQQAEQLSESEVVQRRLAIYPGGDPLVTLYLEGSLEHTMHSYAQRVIKTWRKKLFDISWFMKALNEPIAKMANQEDGCTGHFWQARFRSQALLDLEAVISCMAYVDLNPIRAGEANTLRQSRYTSIQQRLKLLPLSLQNCCGYKSTIRSHIKLKQPDWLVKFEPPKGGLPISLVSYLSLLQSTERHFVMNEQCYSRQAMNCLQSLKLNQRQWHGLMRYFESRFATFVGSSWQLQQQAERLGLLWCKGKNVLG